MDSRYQNEQVINVLNPQFKTLAHLSHDVQEETVQNLKEELLSLNNDCTSVAVEDTTLNDPPLTKKNKKNTLEELLDLL